MSEEAQAQISEVDITVSKDAAVAAATSLTDEAFIKIGEGDYDTAIDL